MTKEEVQIRMGVDNSGVSRGLTDSKAQFSNFAKGVTHEMREIKHLIHGFGTFGIVEGVVETLRPATEWISDFFGKLTFGGFEAEQQLAHLAKTTDITTKELRSMREEQEKINEELKKGEDRLSAIRRNDTFEKSSPIDKVKMLEKELGDLGDKLSRPDIYNEVERMALREQHLKKNIELGKALDELSEDRAKKEKKRQQENEEARKKEEEHVKKLSDLERQRFEAKQDIERSKRSFQERQLSEFRPGLEEIANSQSIYAFDAQQLLQAQAAAREDLLLYGNTAETQRKIGIADKLKEPLERVGLLNPQEKIADATRASQKHLEQIERELKDLNGDKS